MQSDTGNIKFIEMCESCWEPRGDLPSGPTGNLMDMNNPAAAQAKSMPISLPHRWPGPCSFPPQHRQTL